MANITNDNTITFSSDVFNKQVVSDQIGSAYVNKSALLPFLEINDELNGQSGSKLTLVKWTDALAAEEVAEGAALPGAEVKQTTTEVTVKKIGRSYPITYEAQENGYGNIVNKIIENAGQSIALALDKACMDFLNTNTDVKEYTATTDLNFDAINEAIGLFGEQGISREKFILIHSSQRAALVKSKEFDNTTLGAEMRAKGSIGIIAGCNVIVSDNVQHNGTNWINPVFVNPVLTLLKKRDILLESDRNITNQVDVLAVSMVYGLYQKVAGTAIRIKSTGTKPTTRKVTR